MASYYQRSREAIDEALRLFYAAIERDAELARLLELDPAARIANFKEWAPLRRPEDLERLESGLRHAGLPEN